MRPTARLLEPPQLQQCGRGAETTAGGFWLKLARARVCVGHVAHVWRKKCQNVYTVRVISTQELQSLVGCLSTSLSRLESDALRLYLEGSSYEGMAAELGCDTKTIDNALQRVKRKILNHQQGRQVLL